MKKNKHIDEDVIYEEEPSLTGDSFDKKIKKLKSELEKCKKEKEEYLLGWQRSQADFINYKKRSGEDIVNFRKYANEDLVNSILPTMDAFEMSLKDHGESEEIKRWKTGFEYVYNQLKKTLESVGVVQLNPIGEEFDPKNHESIEMINTDDKDKDHKIAEVVMRGYKINEKLLRAPQVKVWVCQE